MWQSVKVSNVFNTLTLKQVFWKTKTFLKELEYRFLVEATKIKNTFPFETALSEANASNYLIFLETVPVLEPLKKSQFDVRTTQICPYLYFS